MNEYFVELTTIRIEPDYNYLIRLGLAGPEGSYHYTEDGSRFAVFSSTEKKVILLSLKK